MEEIREKNIMLVVEFEIKPEHRDKFLTLIHGHARRTLSREDDCLQFDVLIAGKDKPNTVYLVEGYTSMESLDSHMENSGLSYVREIYKDWIVSREISICEVLK